MLDALTRPGPRAQQIYFRTRLNYVKVISSINPILLQDCRDPPHGPTHVARRFGHILCDSRGVAYFFFLVLPAKSFSKLVH